MPDPAGNALEAIWNDEWEKHVVDAALEKVPRQQNLWVNSGSGSRPSV